MPLLEALSDPLRLLVLEDQKVTCKKLWICDEFVFQQFPPKLLYNLSSSLMTLDSKAAHFSFDKKGQACWSIARLRVWPFPQHLAFVAGWLRVGRENFKEKQRK